MSDIWIKSSKTATTKWRKALSIYMKISKTATTKWVTAKVIWIKNTSSGWLRVWPTSGVFPITNPYITTTASGSTPLYGNNTVAANDVMRIGTTYYGRNGTWDPNGFSISSYNYSWRYYSDQQTQPGDYDYVGNLQSGVFSSPSNALSLNNYDTALAADGKYISFKITANASNALYSNSADSKDSYGKIKAVRRTPINLSFVLSGTPAVGATLSIGSSWNVTEARKPDAARNTIFWYRSDSNTSIYDGQGRNQIFTASGYSYVVQAEDLGKYIIAEETAYNTGSDYDIGEGLFTNGLNQVTAVSAIVTDSTPQAFTTISYTKNAPSGGSGGVVRTTTLSWNASTNATRYEIEYEGSNDNVNWTNVQTFGGSPYTSSTSQSVSWGSPKPTGGFDYYYFMRARVRASNPTSTTQVIGDAGAYIYATGIDPGQPSFGSISTGSTTASIPVTAGTAGSNYLYSPAFQYQYRESPFGSYSGTWISSASPISLTGLTGGRTYYIKVRTRNYDDLFSPENETNFTTTSVLTPPTITNVVAGDSSGQAVAVYFTGGSGPYYQIWWTLGVGGTGYDEYGYSSPITDLTGPTSASTAWYAYVRSVSSLTNVGSGPSTTISDWSTGYQFTVTQAPITPTITMNANTSVGTAGATINWSSTNQSYAYVDGTYVGNVNSYTFTGKSASTAYSGTVTVYSTTGNTASANYSFTTTSATITPTVSMNATTNITTSSARINWSSTNQSYVYVDSTYVGNLNNYTFSGLSSGTTYSGTVTVYSTTNNTATANYSFTTTSAPVAPTITSGPSISWGSGNNYTLSATASGASNLEFQVQYSSSSSGSPSTGSATYFFGASSGGGTTGPQASNRNWARTRVRANNTTTGLSSAFTGYTAYA